jgi:hypothetical protein
VAWVIQNRCGLWVYGFLQHIGGATSVVVELRALRDEIWLVSSKFFFFPPFPDIIVEMDALVMHGFFSL